MVIGEVVNKDRLKKEIQRRINYEKKYRLGDYTSGFSQLESGPCCDKCAMDKKEVAKSGRAISLKLLVGCTNPFQIKEVCQCHIPFRKVAVDVRIETLKEIRYIDRIVTNEKVVTVKEYVGSDIEWHDDFIITGYTQQDAGCNNITSIGLDLNDSWTKYFSFVAVDPNVIPYGSVLIIKLDNDLIIALAVDTGGAIKRNRLDLYFDTLREAHDFGIKHNVLVGVIE